MSSCDTRKPLTNNLTNKVQDLPSTKQEKNIKNKENIDVAEKPSKEKQPIKTKRILSGSRIKNLGSRKLSKIASQPILDKFTTRKASYLGYMKDVKNNKKIKKKGPKINNQKAVSKLFKQNVSREHSVSAQGFYPENRRLSKFGKQKSSIQPKLSSRNSTNQTNELTGLGANSFSSHMPLFKRASVDNTKVVNHTICNDMITPRNKKLVPKAALIKKMPSESTERGQSSNYRKVRVGRLGERKYSNIYQEAKQSSRNRSISNRSNSVNGKICKNELGSISKSIFETTTLIRKISLAETTQKFHPGLLTVRDPNKPEVQSSTLKCDEENFTLSDESGIPNQVYTRRQRRVNCINKMDLIDSSTLSNRGKFAYSDKENTKC